MFGSFRERLCLESLHHLPPARAEEASARMETSVMMLGAHPACGFLFLCTEVNTLL